MLPGSVDAKGFTRLVVVGSDRRWLEMRGPEAVVTDWARRGATPEPVRGDYLRLFFTGSGDFPSNPGRYDPARRCLALDRPRVERTCLEVSPALAELLRPARRLSRFTVGPTVLRRLAYLGERTFSRSIKSPAALRDPIELALDRTPRPLASTPRGCFELAGAWRGPAAASRPARFALCQEGVWARGRLYPLRRGVWDWFDLNLGPARRPR